jgi:predicted nucleic acid-binding protein
MSELIVVDTNVIVSILISGNEDILQILSKPEYRFRSTHILFVELFEHSPRIQDKSRLDPERLAEVLRISLSCVRLVDDAIISISSWVEAMRLCSGVDMDDLSFVALALELQAPLWTRDRRLKSHLIKNGFSDFFEKPAS